MFRKYEYGEAAAAGVVVVIGTIIVATFALRIISCLFRRGGPMTDHDTGTPSHRPSAESRPAAGTRRRTTRCARRLVAWIAGDRCSSSRCSGWC